MGAGNQSVSLAATKACFQPAERGHHVVAGESTQNVFNHATHAMCWRSRLVEEGFGIGVRSVDSQVAAIVADDLALGCGEDFRVEAAFNEVLTGFATLQNADHEW